MENYQISFEKAKTMDVYRFNVDEKNIKMIKSGCVKDYEDRFAAALEFGNIDVELNFYPPENKTGTDEKIRKEDTNDFLELFCCVKYNVDGVAEWDSYNTINAFVKTDFTKKNWKTILEKEMFNTLMIFAEENNLKWSELNIVQNKQ